MHSAVSYYSVRGSIDLVRGKLTLAGGNTDHSDQRVNQLHANRAVFTTLSLLEIRTGGNSSPIRRAGAVSEREEHPLGAKNELLADGARAAARKAF